MNFYLASGFSHRYALRNLGKVLEELGHNVVSQWLYLEVRPDPDDPDKDIFLREIGQKNYEDLQRADVLVLDMDGVRVDGNGGAHTELGFFLAKEKPIYLVGNPSNSFHWLPQVKQVASHRELIEVLS